MATRSITNLFKNNLRRISEGLSIDIPAVIRPANTRTGVGEETILATNTYTVDAVPEGSIVGKVYLIVEEAMTGTITVKNSDDSVTFFNLQAITAPGAYVSAVVDTYASSPDGFNVTFSSDQTAGRVRIVASFLSKDTNIGIFA